MYELAGRTDAETKTAIRLEALRLFLQKGFQSPTLEEIAVAAAVSRSTLLDFYRNKADILMQDDDLRILTSPWGFLPEKIRVPVHLWHGDVDSVIPLPHARYLATVIPGATLKICPGEAHMLLWNRLPEILTIAAAAPQQ